MNLPDALASRCVDSREAVLRAVFTAVCEILASGRAEVGDETRKALLQDHRARLKRAEADYIHQAKRAAQLAYLGGTVRGVFLWSFLFALVGVGLWALSPTFTEQLSRTYFTLPLGCAAAGAVGSLASVIWRVSGRSFSVDYDLPRATIQWLGSLRPLLGAIFGVALYFAMKSGALNLQRIGEGSEKTYLFLFVAFLGGFSERFAPDVFRSAERLGGRAAPVKIGVDPDRARRDLSRRSGRQVDAGDRGDARPRALYDQSRDPTQ